MKSIEEKLSEFANNEKSNSFTNYSLDSINKVLTILGNPEKKFKAIHIAGTNGKGSIAGMLNSIFMESGYTVGLYTSPHLIRINERIKINNNEITNLEFSKYLDKVIKISKENNVAPTYFDILTVISFLFFSENKNDITIIETGMGGKSDSTNIIEPILSIISEISMDHTTVLGENIESIAFEKAGIIKKEVVTVSLDNGKKINSIIHNRCKELNSPLYILNNDYEIKNKKNYLLYKEKTTKEKDLKYNLQQPGVFQIDNSALAIKSSLLLKKTFYKINSNSIIKALSSFTIKGRLQKLTTYKEIYFDTAHNISSTKNLIKHFSNIKKDKIIVLTLMSDKMVDEIFKLYKKNKYKIYYYNKNNNRIYIPNIKTITKYNLTIISNINNLNDIVLKHNKKNITIFAGSFTLYEEVITSIKLTSEL